MNSMTGFGKAEKTIDNRTLTMEIKSVNNRFLDINIKMPKFLYFLEDTIRKQIQQKVSRGRLDVFVTYADKSETDKSIEIDFNLAKGLYDASVKLSNQLHLTNDLTITHIMKTPDIISIESEKTDENLLTELVKQTTDEAVISLNKMRAAEGKQLLKDIMNRIGNISLLSNKIKEQAPVIIEEYRNKLKTRITEYLNGIELDQNKLINEVAFYADKINIDEELARLDSHIKQICGLEKSREAVGRRLDFIIQELNREANTICSKANNSNILQLGVELKCEIEKIREQIQNIE